MNSLLNLFWVALRLNKTFQKEEKKMLLHLSMPWRQTPPGTCLELNWGGVLACFLEGDHTHFLAESRLEDARRFTL